MPIDAFAYNKQQFKYRVNSRSPSPDLNFTPVQPIVVQKVMTQTRKKMLPTIPTFDRSDIELDNLEISTNNNNDNNNNNNNLESNANNMNQLKTIKNTRNYQQTITIRNQAQSNNNSSNNDSTKFPTNMLNNETNIKYDESENEYWC